MKRKFMLVISSALVALSLFACGSSEAKTPETVESRSQSEQESSSSVPESKPAQAIFEIGETWTVDGQWSLTVTDVTKTSDRNEFSEKSPDAVYIVNYSYTNIGYEDESGIMDGLFIDMEDSIVDSQGIMGYSYPGDLTNYAQETPIGATCNAQACIGVDNAGSFKINVSKYDGNGNKQSATFNLAVK